MYGWDERGQFRCAVPTVTLYHGTGHLDAAAIVEHVTLDWANPRADFGRGFYTTASRAQAVDLTRLKAPARRQRPAAVEIVVPTADLASLNVRVFAEDDEAFWTFVRHFRNTPRATPHPYDVVVGPVARDWGEPPLPWPGLDQISFHSPAAIALLNRSARNKM